MRCIFFTAIVGRLAIRLHIVVNTLIAQDRILEIGRWLSLLRAEPSRQIRDSLNLDAVHVRLVQLISVRSSLFSHLKSIIKIWIGLIEHVYFALGSFGPVHSGGQRIVEASLVHVGCRRGHVHVRHAGFLLVPFLVVLVFTGEAQVLKLGHGHRLLLLFLLLSLLRILQSNRVRLTSVLFIFIVDS